LLHWMIWMKALMRKHFVSNHYYKKLYKKLQGLSQRTRSVDEYYKKIEIMIFRANILEAREATMTRFLNRLNRKIVNIIELQYYIKLEYMLHMTTKTERQFKRKRGHDNDSI
jgi:hypothetical protein